MAVNNELIPSKHKHECQEHKVTQSSEENTLFITIIEFFFYNQKLIYIVLTGIEIKHPPDAVQVAL